jgi:hypothetical protein
MNLSASSPALAHANLASGRLMPSGTPYRENLAGLRLAAAILAWSRCCIFSRNSGVAQSFLRLSEVACVALGSPLRREDALRDRGLAALETALAVGIVASLLIVVAVVISSMFRCRCHC